MNPGDPEVPDIPSRTIALLLDTSRNKHSASKAIQAGAVASAVERILAHHSKCPSCQPEWTYRFFDSSRSCVSLSEQACVLRPLVYDDVEAFRQEIFTRFEESTVQTCSAAAFSSVARSLDDMVSDVPWPHESDTVSVDSFLDDTKEEETMGSRTCRAGHALSHCLYLVAFSPDSATTYDAFGGSPTFLKEGMAANASSAPNSTELSHIASRSRRACGLIPERNAAREFRRILVELHKKDIRFVWMSDNAEAHENDFENSTGYASAFRNWVSSVSLSASVIALGSLLQDRRISSVRYLFQNADSPRGNCWPVEQHHPQGSQRKKTWRWQTAEVLVTDSGPPDSTQDAHSSVLKYFDAELGIPEGQNASPPMGSDEKQIDRRASPVSLVLKGFLSNSITDAELFRLGGLQADGCVLRPLSTVTKTRRSPSHQQSTAAFAGLMLSLAQMGRGIIADMRTTETDAGKHPQAVFIQPLTPLSASLRKITTNAHGLPMHAGPLLHAHVRNMKQTSPLGGMEILFQPSPLHLAARHFEMFLPSTYRPHLLSASSGVDDDERTTAAHLQRLASCSTDADVVACINGLSETAIPCHTRHTTCPLASIVSQVFKRVERSSTSKERYKRKEHLMEDLRPSGVTRVTRQTSRCAKTGLNDAGGALLYPNSRIHQRRSRALLNKESAATALARAPQEDDGLKELDFEDIEKHFGLQNATEKPFKPIAEKQRPDNMYSRRPTTKRCSAPRMGLDSPENRVSLIRSDTDNGTTGISDLPSSLLNPLAGVPDSNLSSDPHKSRGQGDGGYASQNLNEQCLEHPASPHQVASHVQANGWSTVSSLKTLIDMNLQSVLRMFEESDNDIENNISQSLSTLNDVTRFVADHNLTPAHLDRILRPYIKDYSEVSLALRVAQKSRSISLMPAPATEPSTSSRGRLWKAVFDAFAQSLWQILRVGSLSTQSRLSVKRRKQQDFVKRAVDLLSCVQVTVETEFVSPVDRGLFSHVFSLFFSKVLTPLALKEMSLYKDVLKTLCSEFEQYSEVLPDKEQRTPAASVKEQTFGYKLLALNNNLPGAKADIEVMPKAPQTIRGNTTSGKLRTQDVFVPPRHGKLSPKRPRAGRPAGHQRAFELLKSRKQSAFSTARSQFNQHATDMKRAREQQKPLTFTKSVKNPRRVGQSQSNVKMKKQLPVPPNPNPHSPLPLGGAPLRDTKAPGVKRHGRSDQTSPAFDLARKTVPSLIAARQASLSSSDDNDAYREAAEYADNAKKLHEQESRHMTRKAVIKIGKTPPHRVPESPWLASGTVTLSPSSPSGPSPRPHISTCIPETPQKIRSNGRSTRGETEDAAPQGCASPTGCAVIDLQRVTHVPAQESVSPMTPASKVGKRKSPSSIESRMTRSSTRSGGIRRSPRNRLPALTVTRSVARKLALGIDGARS